MSDNEQDTVVVSAETDKKATEKKKSGTGKVVAIIIAALLVVGIGVFFVMNSDELTSPIKKVGSIDYEAIMSLDEFKNAEKQLNEFAEAKKKEFDAEVKAKAGKSGAEAELQNLSRKMQLEMTQKANEISNPLRTRAEAAVASVARSKGLNVVLDKRIVIYGVEDITAEVQKIFQQEGEIKLTDEVDTSKSKVAYFDQSVVRNLKVFTEAEIKIFQTKNDMLHEYENRVGSLSASEKEALQREMSARLEALQEQIMTPLYQKVTASVNQVSKAQGISLVLDKQHVMYGGRNITDEVVETFLSSVNASTGAGESATPAAVKAGAETPAADADKAGK